MLRHRRRVGYLVICQGNSGQESSGRLQYGYYGNQVAMDLEWLDSCFVSLIQAPATPVTDVRPGEKDFCVAVWPSWSPLSRHLLCTVPVLQGLAYLMLRYRL
jgi:hypothetical protein